MSADRHLRMAALQTSDSLDPDEEGAAEIHLRARDHGELVVAGSRLWFELEWREAPPGWTVFAVSVALWQYGPGAGSHLDSDERRAALDLIVRRLRADGTPVVVEHARRETSIGRDHEE